MANWHPVLFRPPLRVLIVSPLIGDAGSEGNVRRGWREQGPPVEVTADHLATMADELLGSVRANDGAALVRGSRQYLGALLDHLDFWPLTCSASQPFGALLTCLQRELVDAARRLVLAVAWDEAIVPSLADYLATLTGLYCDGLSERALPRCVLVDGSSLGILRLS